jgi:hypothetical protein
MTKSQANSRSLAQSLAVETQVNLPGTVGRLLKQIRDLERVAPLFVQAKLVRSVDRPNPMTLTVGGISTKHAIRRVAGGFLYAAAGSRVDIGVQANVVSTRAEDSVCEVDDIDYEDQSKRFQLIGVRQAYELADRALKSGEHYDMLLLDCPLLLNRSIVAPEEGGRYAALRQTYERTVGVISRFWKEHRESLFPWNRQGPVLAGLASERFGAIVYVSQQDLRTPEGRRHLLHVEELAHGPLQLLAGSHSAIAGIGERRFIYGILASFTRTAGFRMNTQTPRMEPSEVASAGVIGLHYCAGPGTPPRLVQLIGDEPAWGCAGLDQLCGQLMALTVTGGRHAWPMPIQLAARELISLEGFIEHYRAGVHGEMKNKSIENVWLSEIDDLL